MHDNSPICPIPEDMINIIYKHDSFFRRLIEDATSCEELHNLLRFLIWENPDVTSNILHEILSSVS